jgi:hypothetical protein
MERYPLKFAALVLILSIGAFLLYVPLMSLVVVALIATGMALTFSLGIYTGMAEVAERPNWRLNESSKVNQGWGLNERREVNQAWKLNESSAPRQGSLVILSNSGKPAASGVR